MLQEIIDGLNDDAQKIGIDTRYDLASLSQKEGRGGLRVTYFRGERSAFNFNIADFFSEYADRAISLWGLSPGSYTMRIGPDTPTCCDADQWGGIPLRGHLRHVLTNLFIMKMVRQSPGLIRPIEKTWRSSDFHEDMIEPMGVAGLPAIYVAGGLFIYKDVETYKKATKFALKSTQTPWEENATA